MIIDFNAELFGIGNIPLMIDEKSQATLKDIVIQALSTPPADDGRGSGSITAAEQVRRYSLMVRIYDAKEPVDVKAEDVSLIKSLIPLAYPSPAIGGAAIVALDGE